MNYGPAQGIGAGESWVAPVEMWSQGLALLLDRLSSTGAVEIANIVSIGVSALSAPVFLSSPSAENNADSPSPFGTLPFSLPLQHVPLPIDTFCGGHAQTLQNLLGGPEKMARRVGIGAHAGLIAARIMMWRESYPHLFQPGQGGRIGSAGSLLVVESGLWNVKGAYTAPAQGGGYGGGWDDVVLEVIAGPTITGSQGQGPVVGKTMLREMLGPVHVFSHPTSAANMDHATKWGYEVSESVCERWGFRRGQGFFIQ
jgi:xylulokinase